MKQVCRAGFMSMAVVMLSAGALSACASTSVAGNQGPDDLKAFPAATAGQVRTVIQLPQAVDEDALKVELIVGKTQRIDCNNHFFGGEIEERTAEGWGYNYYVLERLGPGASTMMGCPPGSERQAFVRAPDRLVRYNSRLPLVVYAPQDVEVRYRIWRAGEEQVAPR